MSQLVMPEELLAGEIPRDLSEIDAPWVSRALSRWHPGSVVQGLGDFKARHGTTTNIKLRLNYAAHGNPHCLPDVMWLKAGMEAHSGQLAEQLGLYEREARFYAKVQPLVSSTTPRCFYAAASSEARLGVTLLEDLGLKGAELLHATKKVALDHVMNGVRSLGTMHGTFLRNADVNDLPWLPFLLQQNGYWDNTTSPEFLQTWLDEERAKTFPLAILDAARISANLRKLARKIPQDWCGVVHGDAHVGNSYRLADGAIGFYDWQCVGRASPLFDVAYYIISSLDPADRRSTEQDLLREYLLVCDYHDGRLSFDQAWTGYRRYALYGLWAWLTNPTDFHPQPVNIIQSNRFAEAAADLDVFQAMETW